jgi:hypothetical protein
MAQTAKTTRKPATRPKGSSSGSSSSNKSGSAKRSSSRARSNGSASRTSKLAPRSAKKSSSTSARSKPRPNAQSRNGLASVPGVAVEKTKGAAHGISEAAAKAKTPALAAGAGLAGLAGGLALAHRTTQKRILGVPMPNGGTAHAVSKNLAKTAENVGSFGEGMGSLAAEIRRVREGVALAGEPKRSPIEVVLQGLTRRR